MKLLDVGIEYGLYPTEQDIELQVEDYLGANLRKIYEVEKYHKWLASILGNQFATEKESPQNKIADFEGIIQSIQLQINGFGYVGNVSKESQIDILKLKGRLIH